VPWSRGGKSVDVERIAPDKVKTIDPPREKSAWS